jgi:toxin ParE1/3/4
MPNKIYRLSPLAEADLEEIWLYTFRQWSPEQADDYLRNIIVSMEGLASGHKTGHRIDVREGYWKYLVGAHVIYFRYTDAGIDVTRVLHGRMDVERRLQL